MPEDLQQIAAFAAKDVEIPDMRITPQCFLHLQG
jgi:hypothetical protein